MKASTLKICSALVVALSALAGCGVPQGTECTKYVACQAHYDASFSLSATDTSVYEAEGSCWRSETSAADCENACSVANSNLKSGLTDNNMELGDCE